MSQRLSASLKNTINVDTLNNRWSLPRGSKGGMDNSVHARKRGAQRLPVSNVATNIVDVLHSSPVRALRKVKDAYSNTLIPEALGEMGDKKPSPSSDQNPLQWHRSPY